MAELKQVVLEETETVTKKVTKDVLVLTPEERVVLALALDKYYRWTGLADAVGRALGAAALHRVLIEGIPYDVEKSIKRKALDGRHAHIKSAEGGGF
jgi:hypothetical protein